MCVFFANKIKKQAILNRQKFFQGCDDDANGADGDRATVNFDHPLKRVRENGWVRQTPPSPPPPGAACAPPPVPPRGPRQHPGL